MSYNNFDDDEIIGQENIIPQEDSEASDLNMAYINDRIARSKNNMINNTDGKEENSEKLEDSILDEKNEEPKDKFEKEDASHEKNPVFNPSTQIGVEALKKVAMKNPWVIVGIAIGFFALILIAAIFINKPVNSSGILGGSPDKIFVGDCEENDTKCNEIYEKINENPFFGNYEVYEDLLEYCETQRTFGEKIERWFSKLVGIEVLETPCDFAQTIEKYSKKKEEDIEKEVGYEINLSRGLLVATFQHLFDGLVKIDDISSEEDKSVNATDTENMLINMIANGMITTQDIKSLVEYMVYNMNYTGYAWDIAKTECKVDAQGKPVMIPGTDKCVEIIYYGCKVQKQTAFYTNIDKYFTFMRFGGSYRKANVPIKSSDISKTRERYFWNKVTINEIGELIVEKQDPGFPPYIDPEPTIDPATSYQEIKNYNEALNITSEECKIPGIALKSLPKNTEKSEYKLLNKNTDDFKKTDYAIDAFPYKETIDISAYEVTSTKVSEPKIANVMPKGCALNNLPGKGTQCLIQKELTYTDGFLYANFPQYKYHDEEVGITLSTLIGEKYINMGKSIEYELEAIDIYEDFLNEMYGLKVTDLYNEQCLENIEDNGSSENSQDTQNSNSGYKIRLETCIGASESEKASYRSNFPGGWEKINGNYVAKNTISLDDYIKGVTVIEFGRENMTENKKEALKFQLIAQKSYFLSSFLNGDKDVREVNGEIRAAVGSYCTQNFGNVNNLNSSEKSVLDSAYATTKNAVFYKKGTEKIAYVEYGSEFTNKLMNYAISGLNYEQMLNETYVQNYDKGKSIKWYENTMINTSAINLGGSGTRTCSEMLTGGGIFNGNVNTKWPFFPSNIQVTGSQEKKMFICRKMDSGRLDFHGAVDLGVPAGTTVTSPLDGEVISSNELTGDCMLEKNDIKYTVNAVVQVKAIIPGTGKQAVMQFTHLNKFGRLPVGAKVEANKTILGTIGFQDGCSDGTHLDFKVYEFDSKRYYNPSVFIAGILSGSQNIPTSSFTKCTTGGVDVACYDKCCKAAGLLPICGGGL